MFQPEADPPRAENVRCKNMTCIFCKIIAGEIPAHKIYENHHAVAFLDIQPINPGHALIVPREHHQDLLSAPLEVLRDIMGAAQIIAPAIVKAVGADGFNLALNNGEAAGQAVFHTHFHCIPRFADDGLRHWPRKNYAAEEAEALAGKIREQLR
ncbi:MAG: HIT family protein [Patescibacteria group bacterium]